MIIPVELLLQATHLHINHWQTAADVQSEPVCPGGIIVTQPIEANYRGRGFPQTASSTLELYNTRSGELGLHSSASYFSIIDVQNADNTIDSSICNPTNRDQRDVTRLAGLRDPSTRRGN